MILMQFLCFIRVILTLHKVNALLEYIDLLIKIVKKSPIMLEGLPIMLALCFMLWHAYYALNYASIIDAGLFLAPYFIS